MQKHRTHTYFQFSAVFHYLFIVAFVGGDSINRGEYIFGVKFIRLKKTTTDDIIQLNWDIERQLNHSEMSPQMNEFIYVWRKFQKKIPLNTSTLQISDLLRESRLKQGTLCLYTRISILKTKLKQFVIQLKSSCVSLSYSF